MTDTSAPRPPPGIDTARNGEASPEPGTARGRRVVLVTGLSGRRHLDGAERAW